KFPGLGKLSIWPAFLTAEVSFLSGQRRDWRAYRRFENHEADRWPRECLRSRLNQHREKLASRTTRTLRRQRRKLLPRRCHRHDRSAAYCGRLADDCRKHPPATEWG